MGANTDRGEGRKVVIVGAVILAVIVVLGFVFSFNSSPRTCVGLVCGPPPVPVISGAEVKIGTSSPSLCQGTQSEVTCSVDLNGGDRGTVLLNVTVVNATSSGSNLRVAFLVYSSAAGYVTFTPVAPYCSFSSAPSLQIEGCEVSSSEPVTFQFPFTVAQSYGNAATGTGRWSDSITVSMWMTCCWP